MCTRTNTKLYQTDNQYCSCLSIDEKLLNAGLTNCINVTYDL